MRATWIPLIELNENPVISEGNGTKFSEKNTENEEHRYSFKNKIQQSKSM